LSLSESDTSVRRGGPSTGSTFSSSDSSRAGSRTTAMTVKTTASTIEFRIIFEIGGDTAVRQIRQTDTTLGVPLGGVTHPTHATDTFQPNLSIVGPEQRHRTDTTQSSCVVSVVLSRASKTHLTRHRCICRVVSVVSKLCVSVACVLFGCQTRQMRHDRCDTHDRHDMSCLSTTLVGESRGD
jgi:hypothetical protein